MSRTKELNITVEVSEFKPENWPEYAKMELARELLISIRNYFKQPGVEEEFEKWRAERIRNGLSQPDEEEEQEDEADI